ncbi:MAG: LarC family nickel insertion protein, partial [bacterium]|nr:LarC family nickel insertion protein [bacterium]
RAAELEPTVRDRALGIVGLIAETEAEIHGVPVDDVVLHELGAIDSVADVVGAAHLIEELSPASWSTSPLPVGGGFIDTAHGRLPVPAPATQRLLSNFPFVDDGISGERITPTGAAILRYLDPSFQLPYGVHRSAETGHGFGTRELPGVANVLRARCYVSDGDSISDEQVAVLEFMVDDQTPEDLAVGLDAVRELSG